MWIKKYICHSKISTIFGMYFNIIFTHDWNFGFIFKIIFTFKWFIWLWKQFYLITHVIVASYIKAPNILQSIFKMLPHCRLIPNFALPWWCLSALLVHSTIFFNILTYSSHTFVSRALYVWLIFRFNSVIPSFRIIFVTNSISLNIIYLLVVLGFKLVSYFSS